MRATVTNQYLRGGAQRGLSLIELMVALLIAGLLSLGIVQIFGASRLTYQTQEGLSRVQESGRYATQYLQRQLRMVGYMGCGSDAERLSQVSFVNHLALYSATIPGGDTVDAIYRFQRPIQAFPSDAVPAGLIDHAAKDNTDVLILRVLGDDSVPALVINATNNASTELDTTVADPLADVFQGTGGATVAYALQSCRSVDIFAGALAGNTVTAQGRTPPNNYLDPTVTSCGAGGCPWDFRISNAFLNAPPASTGGLQLNAEIHRAEFYAFFVAASASAGAANPDLTSLYVRRFTRDGMALGASEELAEGVESLKFSFGIDSTGDGQIDAYQSAVELEAASGATEVGRDNIWRQVLSVRLGMLIRSPDQASVGATESGDPRTYSVLGVDVTPDNPSYLRQVYETTVALRNRIFNS